MTTEMTVKKEAITGADLPVELMEFIISYAVQDDTATCAAICRTDRRCNKLATPLLYKKIVIATAPGEVEDWKRRIQALCQTCLERPHLINHVVDANLYIDPELGSSLLKCTSALYAKSIYKSVIKLLADFDCVRPWHGSYVTNEDCLILILLCCKNLQSLRLIGDLCVLKVLVSPGRLPFSLRLIEGHPGISRPVFGPGTVRKLILEPIQTPCPLVVEDLEPLLAVPGLHTLIVRALASSYSIQLNPSDTRDYIFEESIPESQLQQLIIRDCGAECFDLEWTLYSARFLTKIDIQWGAGEANHRRDDWAAIGAFLRRCKSLVSIIFGGGEDPAMDLLSPLYHTYGSEGIGPLRGYLQDLKLLHLPKIALLGTSDDGKNLSLYGLEVQDWGGSATERFLEFYLGPGVIADLVPDSLEELIVASENSALTAGELAFLADPGLAGVKDVTLHNCTGTTSISRRYGVLQD